MRPVPHDELAPLYASVQVRPDLVAGLFTVAAMGWVWAVREMRGMDGGPWTALGGLGWFVGAWVVMMTAMMVPSLAPTVALYARVTRGRSPALPWLFAGGYLAVWVAAGVAAFTLRAAATTALGGRLAWESWGQTLAGATLVAAAAYELTPLKDVCLGMCRHPLGTLVGSRSDDPPGAVRTGVRNGAWCVGCCWALMTGLFALGVMSAVWMAVVAGIIAAQKALPWRRAVTYGTAAVLLVLGVLVLTAPDLVPALTIPSSG